MAAAVDRRGLRSGADGADRGVRQAQRGRGNRLGVYGRGRLLRCELHTASGDLDLGTGHEPARGCHLPSLAVDADGQPLDGSHRYVLRFEPGKLPPVNGFWSVTAYDADGYLIPNALRRSSLGDRSGLTAGPDGAIELHIQTDNPGPDLESNWLPVKSGTFNLMLRLYSPARLFLTGDWTPPLVHRTS
ncbi:DUF1214 domain-containing protein [Nocardia tengchongensis]|uniref:DUF1214 domain-containing protein n=1 Tax=Nocardia tengchongensis TaxID=2055889 RepID=UPI00365A6B75